MILKQTAASTTDLRHTAAAPRCRRLARGFYSVGRTAPSEMRGASRRRGVSARRLWVVVLVATTGRKQVRLQGRNGSVGVVVGGAGGNVGMLLALDLESLLVPLLLERQEVRVEGGSRSSTPRKCSKTDGGGIRVGFTLEGVAISSNRDMMV
jgi:citrate lyase alpha subunit